MGPLKPEVVQATAHSSNPIQSASNVLILGEEDASIDGKPNYWVAEMVKTTGQGFTLKVDNCKRLIGGCQIKNKGQGYANYYATKEFRVSGSINENGPWETLVEDQLVDTRHSPAPLVNFTFEEPVEIQFIKFDLISYWGTNAGGLQYFAAILATGEKKHNSYCIPNNRPIPKHAPKARRCDS